MLSNNCLRGFLKQPLIKSSYQEGFGTNKSAANIMDILKYILKFIATLLNVKFIINVRN